MTDQVYKGPHMHFALVHQDDHNDYYHINPYLARAYALHFDMPATELMRAPHTILRYNREDCTYPNFPIICDHGPLIERLSNDFQDLWQIQTALVLPVETRRGLLQNDLSANLSPVKMALNMLERLGILSEHSFLSIDTPHPQDHLFVTTTVNRRGIIEFAWSLRTVSRPCPLHKFYLSLLETECHLLQETPDRS